MIETARLTLRPWRDADRDRFAAITQTPGMNRFLGEAPGRATADALIDKRLADYARHGTCYWALELRATGELVGTCGVRFADDYPDTPVYRMPEAGWRIGEQWQGRRLATEAAGAAIAWFWCRYDAEFVAAWTTPHNQPSLQVMVRLGMEPAPELDFDRAVTGERCLVHRLAPPRAV